MDTVFRKTTQALAPTRHPSVPPGQYDIYPGFDIGAGKIATGYAALAERLRGHRQVIIDGYGGVLWENLRSQLDKLLTRHGLRVTWTDASVALKSPQEIDTLVAPCLGGEDPLFGKRFNGQLSEFFAADKLSALQPDPAADMSIIYGSGAALSQWQGLLVYVDLPKNEIQFRSRAGAFRNIGAAAALSPNPREMYKRFYFVDWVALNRHKADLLRRIDVIVDEQRPDQPAHASGDDLRAALSTMSRNYFRVRPWFEPGPWGGQWIKAHVPQLPRQAPNYAWSFELIVPENGLLLQSDGLLLEVSFDCLMFQAHRDVLGDCAERFGTEFPVRFDFLDTFDGGNLSLQCHPRPDYVRHHFGESFTQDETYYMLDCRPGARVYLGFKDSINPAEFRAALERSYREAAPVDVERFVTTLAAHKHDLFLIPNGTIHCAGQDCLVLEISATPYIFTFKMYDWLRLDLDGNPRPLNIARAFDNLYFERKGERVMAELVAHPRVFSHGEGWQVIHLPTHAAQFYDVHRIEFEREVEVETAGSFHVLSLVEGSSIVLETGQGLRQRFSYAETFVVPAAAGTYRLINEGAEPVKVVKCFIKGDILTRPI